MIAPAEFFRARGSIAGPARRFRRPGLVGPRSQVSCRAPATTTSVSKVPTVQDAAPIDAPPSSTCSFTAGP